MRLLVTRPEPDAERTAAALRARGHVVLVVPLLRIEPVEQAAIGPGPFVALLVTSANAAPAIARHARFAQLRTLPVFAVGDRSAEAMRAVGFADVASAQGDVSDLARWSLRALKPGASLLYLAGADRSGDLAGLLSGRGFAVKHGGGLSRCRDRRAPAGGGRGHGPGVRRRAAFFPAQRRKPMSTLLAPAACRTMRVKGRFISACPRRSRSH